MRRLFPDGKGGMRKVRAGKMIAQGAHAAGIALSNRLRNLKTTMERGWLPVTIKSIKSTQTGTETYAYCDFKKVLDLTDSAIGWITGNFAKVVTYVDTEEELLELYEKIKAEGIWVEKVMDSGLTEFNGEPTLTAIGVGPDTAERIDPFTGHLPLL